MSGHSKWATIKHKKGAADAKRGKIFSKLGKAISVAAKEGGADPAMNFTLRLQIEKAKSVNMPKDNIERAIARGTGEGGEAALELVTFEGMAPGGVSVIVEALTDNNNRTFPIVKNIFTKQGGNMDAKVLWQFDRKGVVRGKLDSVLSDDAELALIEAGAEDIEQNEDQITVVGAVSDLQTIEGAVSKAGIKVESGELEYIPNSTVDLDDAGLEKLAAFVELLEDDDDVSTVYTNVA